MGQANQRGTYEERVRIAIQRNKLLEEQLPKDPKAFVNKIRKRHGTQRLATILVASGMLGVGLIPPPTTK